MSLFRPSSESSLHPSTSGESLSEAVLDTSSARDDLPEQYRAHFDELRSGILVFCHEFKIPVETLRSKEAFGAELNSKKIPPERMAHAVSLFARLEHLVTNKEPLLEKEEPLEYAERLYRLKEQYTAQVELLKRVGILQEGAITGIDGEEYSVPTLEQIAQRLYERRELLETKQDQGFVKLLLVPFGMSLDTLIFTFKRFLLDYKQTHLAFGLDILEPLRIFEDYQRADIGDPPKIIYNPQSFSLIEGYQGKTKTQILKEQNQDLDSTSGWVIHLLQPSIPNDSHSKGFASIPRKGKGKNHGQKKSRPDFEANKSAVEYLSVFQEAKINPVSPYYGESGLTPEDWILTFMIHLTETGKPLDNYQDNDIESSTYLTRAFFQSSTLVPYAFWARAGRQVFFDYNLPDSPAISIGVRSSVII